MRILNLEFYFFAQVSNQNKNVLHVEITNLLISLKAGIGFNLLQHSKILLLCYCVNC